MASCGPSPGHLNQSHGSGCSAIGGSLLAPFVEIGLRGHLKAAIGYGNGDPAFREDHVIDPHRLRGPNRGGCQIGNALAQNFSLTEAVLGRHCSRHRVLDTGSQRRLHTAHRAIPKHRHAAQFRFQARIEKSGIVRGDLLVARAQRFRMIGPVDGGSDALPRFAGQREDDQVRIVHHGRARIVDESIQFGGMHHGQRRRGRFQGGQRALGGLRDAIDHETVVIVIDSRLAQGWSPQPHGVRTFVHVRGSHHHVRLRNFGAHTIHIVDEKADQIDLAHDQRLRPGAEGQTAGIQIVVYGNRYTIVTEPGHVHRRAVA